MGKQDPLSQLLRRRIDLRARGQHFEREIAELEPAIQRARGSLFRKLMDERDGLREQLVESRTQLGPIEADIAAIQRREAAPPKASIHFAHEVGEDGLPVDSIRHLRW